MGLPLSYFRGNFQKILCRPHPLRGIKPLSEHLFLLFANNYWFPITLLCLAATHFWHRKLIWNNAIVYLPRYLKWREKLGLHNNSFQITLTNFSVIAMIGDAHIKIRQTNQKTLLYGGFTMVKNPPKLIQMPPTIFHPMLGKNYWLQMTETGFAG